MTKIVLEDDFLHMYYSDFNDVWKFMFRIIV